EHGALVRQVGPEAGSDVHAEVGVGEDELVDPDAEVVEKAGQREVAVLAEGAEDADVEGARRGELAEDAGRQEREGEDLAAQEAVRAAVEAEGAAEADRA